MHFDLDYSNNIHYWQNVAAIHQPYSLVKRIHWAGLDFVDQYQNRLTSLETGVKSSVMADSEDLYKDLRTN